MNHIIAAKKEAAAIIENAYKKAVAKGSLSDHPFGSFPIEIPRDAANGDLASSFAMQAARALHKSPRDIGAAICENIELAGSSFSSCETAGAGFINFRLGEKWMGAVLSSILREGDDFAKTQNPEHPEKIIVEFVSANPTGPMHMGNARGGVLGDLIAQTLALSGNDVSREFLINDAGNQISLFGKSLEARYLQIFLGEDKVPFPEDGYHGEDVKDLARAFADEFGDRFVSSDEAERCAFLSKFGLEKNIAKMKEDLGKYRIHYDRWFSETELHDSGYIEETIAILKDKGMTYEKDGALWLRTGDHGCEKDDVLRRANGFYTYFAADIAYHRDKLERRGFDRAINVWGADHHGHVKRLQTALDMLGLDGSNRLEIVLMQLVRLMRDGEVVRMSKRTGNAITLCDLLDEIDVDAARFFFNSRAADTHLEFDLDLAVRQDSDNPVYYVQYAHARIMSILKNLKAEGIETDLDEEPDFSLLSSEDELALIRELAKLPEEVRLAAEVREPSKIDKYVVSLAGSFHRFYTSCRIADAEENLRKARIALCLCTKKVIANALSIIGVTAPDHM